MIKEEKIKAGQVEDEYVRMTITGKVDDILQKKCPIELQSIFQDSIAKGKRNVVLLEGAPGCGKSTLSVYIFQQVSQGQMFSEYPVVILVRLRDPVIQKAKGIADLLPCRDSAMSQQAASSICANDGQGVLFILDGWDELPSECRQNSIFRLLIQPELSQKNRLHKSAVIVTSRPIASGDLHPVVSSRIEILGFTPKELKEYFTKCLEDDTIAVDVLLEKIQENPAVAGSCYLPLNASILLHLFKSDNNTLPTTQYGIFSELVLSCIFRHLNERTEHKNLSLLTLDELPEFIRKPFLYLCKLAYQGLMEDRVIFSSLPADLNTLGLLQGVQSFIRRGKAVSYNFLHLSVQEMLAAFYMATQLPAKEQVSKFYKLFDKSRFSAVFQFYAAITKLTTAGVSEVITRVAITCGVEHPESKEKTLLLSLLHCLYETQDPSLCESVSCHLQHGLNFMNITLTPSDCLCIGYFLSCICKTTAGVFKVNLSECSIGDQGCKYLVSGLHKCLETHSSVTTTLSMDLFNNDIKDKGVSDLSELFDTDCIKTFNLDFNSNVSDGGVCIIAAKLKYNTSIRTLRLADCGCKSKCIENLASALTINSSLEELYCVPTPCDDVMEQLANAIGVNHSLKVLHLVDCGMTDEGLESLAKSMEHNKSLEQLHICNCYCWILTSSSGYGLMSRMYPNTITEKGISVLTKCLMNSSLSELMLPGEFESFTTTVQEAVNDARKKNGLPFIKVTGQ